MKGTEMKKEFGFSLPEILITIAIVGSVAAMTLPNLLTNINDYVTTRKVQVIEKKIIQGLKHHRQ